MTGAKDTLRIHSAGLELLANVGIGVLGDGALSVFAGHGARIDGRRVFLPVGMVEQALADAPRTFTVRGRRPARDLEFGGASAVLASASGATFTVAGETLRPSTFADFETAVKLGYGSPVIHVHGNGPAALDLPMERRERTVLCTAHTLSDKLVQSYVSTPDELSAALTVANIVFGESWADQPRLIAVMNPTSPLQLSAEVCTSIETLAWLGQVVCATPCVMGGTTGPLSLAGILAQQHAESLAEITLAQLVRPGSPVLYGGTSAVSSMRDGGLLLGTAAHWLLMAETVRLGHELGLPVRAGGCLTDAHAVDYQAGAESAADMLVVLREGVDFVLHAAGMMSSFNGFSAEKFVLDEHFIELALQYYAGLSIDDLPEALDVIAEVGPAGSFLGRKHTRAHAPEFGREDLFGRDPAAARRARDAMNVSRAASRAVEARLAAYEPPDDLDAVVRRQLDEFCAEA